MFRYILVGGLVGFTLRRMSWEHIYFGFISFVTGVCD